MQYVALSATLAEPAATAARYFPAAQVISVPGGRALAIEMLALAADSAARSLTTWPPFRGTAGAKLWSSATRARGRSLRHCRAHRRLALWPPDLCPLLEPGSPPPPGDRGAVCPGRRRALLCQQHAGAGHRHRFHRRSDPDRRAGQRGGFAQRIGRAGRRQRTIHAACFYRTPLEEALLHALIAAPEPAPTSAPFRPSVAVQQIFSLLMQSPTGAVRLQPLADLFAGLLTAADLETILGHLHAAGYLTTARAGEWRAGERLKRLVDLQASEQAPLSLYSNLKTPAGQVKLRDQQSQRWWPASTTCGSTAGAHAGGTPAGCDVVRRRGVVGDGPSWSERRPTAAVPVGTPTAELRVGAALACAPWPDARRCAAGGDPTGWLFFHWLGDVNGQALLDLLSYTLAVEETAQPGLCLLLREEPHGLPAITATQMTRYLRDHYLPYESLLALGAYQRLLPRQLRRQAVVEQFDVSRFVEAVAMLRVQVAPETLSEDLRRLVATDEQAS